MWREGGGGSSSPTDGNNVFSIQLLPCDIFQSRAGVTAGTGAGVFKQFMGARNRVGIGLSYRPARAGIFKRSMGARNRVGIGLPYQPPGYIGWRNSFLGIFDSWAP